MANVRDLKRRIRAIKNTKKITKAMEMVAAAKLRRAQERAVAARPYADLLRETMVSLVRERGIEGDHPLLAVPDRGDVVFCLVTADRGLAGSYNANLIRFTQAALAAAGERVGLVAVGRKGLDHFRRRGVPVHAHFVNVGEEARFALAEEIAEVLMGLFVEGKAREVRLVFSRFVSALSQRPEQVPVLPVVADRRLAAASAAAGPAAEGGAARAGGEADRGRVQSFIHVPSAAAVLAELLPRLVKNAVYQALLEAKASEHAARMTAMRSATDNAQELIEELTLEFNRARQTVITTEISEIVGGAEALKG